MIWEVSLSGANGETETFETTDDHPWWIVDDLGNGSWKTTNVLSAGMIVTTADNQTMAITSITQTKRTDATYNITVADFETYFVGKQQVLVHNCKNKRNSPEKTDLTEMAKQDKKTGGVSEGDMQAYKELNNELPDPYPANKVRGPESHQNAKFPSSKEPHGHVGPVDHIPIKTDAN